MNDPFSIADEVRGRHEWRRRLREFDDDAAGTDTDTGEGQARGGQELAARLTGFNRKRFQRLLALEPGWGTDYEFLVGPACWIVETELAWGLAQPARPIVPLLARALGAADDWKHRNLWEWVGGRSRSATMGTVCCVVDALRAGLTADKPDPDLVEFAKATYPEPLRTVIREEAFGECLDKLRRYRNEVQHGRGRYTRREYEDFTFRVVSAEQFGQWNEHGPAPSPPPPGLGALHHHLSAGPRPRPDGGAGPPPEAARLLAQTPAADPGFAVEVRAAAAARAADRSVTVRPAPPAGAFRLGDRVRFTLTATAAAHLYLLNIDADGRVVVLRPNHWQPDVPVGADQPCHVPDGDDPEVRFDQQPGTEHFKAIATRRPLRAALAPEGDDPVRELNPDEAAALEAELAALPAGVAEATLDVLVVW